jgi:hypothetical protein
MIDVNPDPRDTVGTVRRLLAPALPPGVEAFIYGSMARAAASTTRPGVPPMDIDVCIVADVNAGIIDRQSAAPLPPADRGRNTDARRRAHSRQHQAVRRNRTR